MKIEWKRCQSYDEAKDFSRIIYLHEWNGQPYYWGKAHNSFFGGNKRKMDGLHATGRYSSGYRHWIDGCLEHGARLYVGLLDEEALKHIDEVENYLIHNYGYVLNKKVAVPRKDFEIDHVGDIPESISKLHESCDSRP